MSSRVTRRVFAALAFAWLHVSINAADAATVGALGSPEMIDFSGNATFPTRVLRKSLGVGAEFLTAAHPSNSRAAYLQMIEDALARGYLRAGFPAAKIRAALNSPGSRVEVTINEGPRITNGDIRIEGATHVAAESLVADLTATEQRPERDFLTGAVERVLHFYRAPKEKKAAEEELKKKTGLPVISNLPPGLPDAAARMAEANQIFVSESLAGTAEPLWTRDQPARLDPGFIDEITTRVRARLSDECYPLSTVTPTLAIDQRERKATLIVRINEGPRARIATIEVKGNVRNPAQDIIRATGLTVGGNITVTALAAARVALWNSARFYAFDVVPRPRDKVSADVDVLIEVEEMPAQPPLSEPLSRGHEALVRLANWVSTQAARRQITAEFSLKEALRGTLTLGGIDGIALDTTMQGSDRLSLAYGRDGIRILARHSGVDAVRVFSQLRSMGRTSLWLVTSPDPEKTGRHSSIQMGASVSTRSNADALFETDVIVSPSLLCEVLGEETPEFDNGVVTLTEATRKWALRWHEATGELIEYQTLAATDGSRFTVKPAAGEFQRIDRELKAIATAAPPANPSPFLPHLLAHPLIDVALKTNRTEWQLTRSRLIAAGHLLELVLGVPKVTQLLGNGEAENDPAFFIPPKPGETDQPGMIASMLGAFYYQIATMLWPQDTWPAKLSRELFYVMTGNTRNTAAVMSELLRDSSMGPLANIAAARLLRPHDPVRAWTFARQALDRGTAENFRADWRLLLSDNSDAGQLLQQLIRVVGELPTDELIEISHGLPTRDVEVVRRVHEALREKKDAPIADVIEPFLDAWWNEQMRPNLESHIGAIMVSDQPFDPLIDAFVVNGLPISRKFYNLAQREPQRFTFLPAPTGRGTPSAATKARDVLVQLALLDFDWKSRQQGVDPNFLARQIAAEVRDQHGGDQRKFRAALAKDNLTEADHAEITRWRCIADATREQIAAKVARPTRAEIDRALGTTLPPLPELRHVRAIGFAPAGDAAARARSLQSELARDNDFDARWTQYSRNAPAGVRTFDFPGVGKKDMQPALADAAFALAPGATSDVVEAAGWAYVLKVVAVDHRDSPADRELQAAEIAATRKRDAAIRAHLSQLRRAAIVQTLPNPGASSSNTTLPATGVRLEMESVPVAANEKTRVMSQSLERWGGGTRWSGGKQALCTSAAGGWIEWDFTVESEGDYTLDLFGTRAVNFCQVQPAIDGTALGPILELYGASVTPTGARRLGQLRLAAGKHTFRCTVVGKHPSSTNYQFGIDALDIVPVSTP